MENANPLTTNNEKLTSAIFKQRKNAILSAWRISQKENNVALNDPRFNTEENQAELEQILTQGNIRQQQFNADLLELEDMARKQGLL